MNDDVKIRVFIESRSETLQAADMDTVGHPMCTGTNASDWGASTLGMSGKLVPQDHLILLDAASRAADKLGLELEIVDIADYSFFQKRKLKKEIPSIEVGEEVLTGLPTSDEIVMRVQSSLTV